MTNDRSPTWCPPPFLWRRFDIVSLLPVNWQARITAFAVANAMAKTLRPRSITSRELSLDLEIPVLTVGGYKIRSGLPWLYALYEHQFRALGQSCVSEPLSVARDPRYAINLNVQQGTGMRYECHVDSNPLEGLLYVTMQPAGSGGELIVARNPWAIGPEQISHDCERICPVAGDLIFFDARFYPHFVAPLTSSDDIRIAVTMNFYTPDCPEEARPKDLNMHLFGEP